MAKKHKSLLPLAVACWLLAAGPAGAELHMSRATRLFVDREAILLIHGSIADRHVVSIDDPLFAYDPQEDGEVIKLTLRTETVFDLDNEVAYQLVIPKLKAGDYRLIVEGIDVGTGFRTVYLNYGLLPEPPLELRLDKKQLLSTETFSVNAKFRAASGEFGSSEVAGDRIRVNLGVGCHYCPIPFPHFDFDLTTTLGPLAPGEYTVEIRTSAEESLDPEFGVLQRERISVWPDPPSVQNGRFVIEIPLDAPHGGQARLAALPSQDSALFYFFNPENWEIMVKVLDGCALNGHYWVYGAASTDVGYTVRVEDTSTHATREYRHPAGTPAPAITDVTAFVCPAGAEGASR